MDSMAKKQVDLASAGFRIDGTVTSFSNAPLCVVRAIEALEKLPFKELLTTRQLAELLGIQHNSFAHHASNPRMSKYKYYTGTPTKGYLWGSKKTLAELKRLAGE
jgi:hypothetical protein